MCNNGAMCNNTQIMYIIRAAPAVGHRRHALSRDMKYLVVISSVATLLHMAAANYLPAAYAYNGGGPLVLPAPGCGCGGYAPANVGPLLGAIAPALPLLAPALSNTISDAIVASLPPLLDAALPTVLNSVLTAAGPLLEAAAPCGCASPCGAPYAPLGLAAPCACSYASPLIAPPMYASPCAYAAPGCLW